MKDLRSLNLSLLIPVAMGSMITSVGCSHEGSWARKQCKAWADCDDDSFDDNFESVGECTKYFKLQAKADNYFLKIEEGPECVSAKKKAEKCLAKGIDECDIWEGDGEAIADLADDCENEIEDLIDECDEYARISGPANSFSYYSYSYQY